MGGFNSAPLPGGDSGGDSDLPAGPSSPAPSFSDIGGSSLGGLSSGGVTLSAPVGPGAANDPGDVLRVESVLSDADLLGRPPGRTFGDDTLGAIKTAQARLNDDPRVDVGRRPLKLDGLVNPDGPTQAATRRLAGDVIARRAATAPKPQPPRPGTATAPRPATGPARVVATPSGPHRETLEQTVKRFASKPPLSTAAEPPPAPESAMTGDQVAALERLVGGLRQFTHPGPVAKDIADAFRNNAPGTVAEFKVVRNVLEKTGTPDQVNNLTEGVRAELTPKDRGRFDKLLAGTDGGVKKPTAFEVPAYRNQAVPQDAMDRFMGQHGQAKPNMRNALGQIFAAEGGFKDDRSGGTAHAGITDGALEQAKTVDPSLKGVAHARDLTEEQVAKAYRAVFDDNLRRYGGAEALETIKDPKTAAAFADTLFMHGPNGGARIVKQATNNAIGKLTPEQQRQIGVSELGGQTGPKDTLDAMRRLSNGGHGTLLRKEIADERENFAKSDGARRRINHFRFR